MIFPPQPVESDLIAGGFEHGLGLSGSTIARLFHGHLTQVCRLSFLSPASGRVLPNAHSMRSGDLNVEVWWVTFIGLSLSMFCLAEFFSVHSPLKRLNEIPSVTCRQLGCVVLLQKSADIAHGWKKYPNSPSPGSPCPKNRDSIVG